MGTFYSPTIVKDGLVLCLDAANPRSYPGSGTNWYDLSGNGNHGIFTGGVTFNSSISGGVLVTNGSTGYINITTLNLSSTNYTVMDAAKYVSEGGRIFSALNNNWLMGWWGSTTENYYAVGWVSGSGAGPSDTNWRIITATGNILSDVYTLYVNSAQTVSNGGGTAGPNGFSLGQQGPGGEFSNSNISYLMAYNRVLSSTEILQNYNATKSRFGL